MCLHRNLPPPYNEQNKYDIAFTSLWYSLLQIYLFFLAADELLHKKYLNNEQFGLSA
jgi:hypothetical protein